jgi:uncharacterized protein (TIGR02145 family)
MIPKNILFAFSFIVTGMLASAQNSTITDIDSNVYQTVTIGTQVWMAENLKTTRYSNGDLIHNITCTSEWDNLKSGACCDYKNTPGNSIIYGKLYNWYAVNDSRNIAPIGWHVPSATEWTTLIAWLGGESVAGGKLKETSTNHWNSPNACATNESGFTALPGGSRYFSGQFLQMGMVGFWWSSSKSSTGYAYSLNLSSDSNSLGYYNFLLMSGGLSVRCVKD